MSALALVCFAPPLILLSIFFQGYQWKSQAADLKVVKINFLTPTFEKITMDRAASYTDMLAAIGGTFGLLTGFSIISGVEICFFIYKIITAYVKKF